MAFSRQEFDIKQQINYTTPTGPKCFAITAKSSHAGYTIYQGFISKPNDPNKEVGFLINDDGAEQNKEINLCPLLANMKESKNFTLLLNATIAEQTVIFIPAGSKIYFSCKFPKQTRVFSVMDKGNESIKTEVKSIGSFTLPKPVTPAASSACAAAAAAPKVVPQITPKPSASTHVIALTPPDGTCMYYAITLASLARFWRFNANNSQHLQQLTQACQKLFAGTHEFALSADAIRSIPNLLKQHHTGHDFVPLIKRNDATLQSLVENNLRNRLFHYMNANAEQLAANAELRTLAPPDINAQYIRDHANDAIRPNEWGEMPQLVALSQMLRTYIVVHRGPHVSANVMPDSISFGREFQSQSEALHLFYTGDHYNFYIHHSHIPPKPQAAVKPQSSLEEWMKKELEKSAQRDAQIKTACSPIFAKATSKSKAELEAEKQQDQQRKQANIAALEDRKRKFQEEKARPVVSKTPPKKAKTLHLAPPQHAPALMVRAISAPHDAIDQRRRGMVNLQAWLTKLEQGILSPRSSNALTPRNYQKLVIQQFIAERSKNKDHRANSLVVLPTGTGKTGVMSMLSGNSGEKHIILAPWVDVVTQTQQAILQFAPAGLRVAGVQQITWTPAELAERRRLEKVSRKHTKGMSKEEAKETQAYKEAHSYSSQTRLRKYKELIEQHDIIVVSYQLMYRKKVYKHFPWKLIDSISLDEAHHIVAPESREMLLHLRDHEKKEIIGYTATPSEELYELFGFQKDGSDNPITSLTMMEAIDQKALSPLQFAILTLQQDAAHDKVNLTNKKITDALVERKLNQPSYNHAIINYILNTVSPCNQKPLRDMTTLIACAGVDHIKVLYKKLNELVTIDQIDPHHTARTQYAQKILEADLETKIELIRRAKLDIKPNELTPPLAQQLANSTFKVASGLYSATGKPDDDNEKEMLLDKKIYEMGGIRFMVTCGKLGEGYSLSRIEHLVMARMPTSKALVSQLGGRVSRLDAENPAKIGHITQIATDDAIDRIALYAQQHFVQEGAIHFCYPPKALDALPAPIQLNILPVPEPRAAAEQHWKESEKSKISRVKRTTRLQKKQENKSNPERRAAPKRQKPDFVASIGELKRLLDELKMLFRKVEHLEIDEASEPKEQAAAAASQAEAMQDTLPSQAQPSPRGASQSNAGDGAITRNRHAFLLRADETLTSMGNFLNPLYQAISTGSGWYDACRSARTYKKPDTNKTEEMLLTELCETAKELLRKIFRLRRHQYTFTSVEAFNTPMEEEQSINDIDHPDKLEKCITLLKNTIEEQKDPIVAAIKRLKEESKNKSKAQLNLQLGIKRYARYKAKTGITLDYIQRTQAIYNTLDLNNELSIFDIIKQLQKQEENKPSPYTNSYKNSYTNYTGVLKEKLKRDPSQWNSIHPETGETVLHWLTKISQHLGYIEGQVHERLLTLAFDKMNPALLGHPDNTGILAIQIKGSRKAMTVLIMGYADKNFDFYQSGLQEKDYYQYEYYGELTSYYRAVRKKDYNFKDPMNENNTVLHDFSILPVYLIDEILKQSVKLDFTAKNNSGITPLDSLIIAFDRGTPGKQLVTLLKILKLYPTLLSENEDIYHRALSQMIRTRKRRFPFELLQHFPNLDRADKAGVILETTLVNDLKSVFIEDWFGLNPNFFKALKTKNLSDKARNDLVALFKETVTKKCLSLKVATRYALDSIAHAKAQSRPLSSYHVSAFANTQSIVPLDQFIYLYEQFLNIFGLDKEDSIESKITEVRALYATYKSEYSKIAQTIDARHTKDLKLLQKINKKGWIPAAASGSIESLGDNELMEYEEEDADEQDEGPGTLDSPVYTTEAWAMGGSMEYEQDTTVPFLGFLGSSLGHPEQWAMYAQGLTAFPSGISGIPGASSAAAAAGNEDEEGYAYDSDSSDAEESQDESAPEEDLEEEEAESPQPASHQPARTSDSEEESESSDEGVSQHSTNSDSSDSDEEMPPAPPLVSTLAAHTRMFVPAPAPRASAEQPMEPAQTMHQ